MYLFLGAIELPIWPLSYLPTDSLTHSQMLLSEALTQVPSNNQTLLHNNSVPSETADEVISPRLRGGRETGRRWGDRGEGGGEVEREEP